MNLEPRRPEAWQSLLDALRPPPGYELEAGIGTTYGLSFEALTAVLLSFVHAEGEAALGDVPTLLHAFSRVARRLSILVQRGTMRVEAERMPPRLFGLYDRLLCDVGFEETSFHPKVWALRFARLNRPDLRRQPERLYRMVCASRNLSLNRCWELAVRLDGGDAGEGEQPSPIGRDVAQFIRYLISLPGVGKRVPRAVHQLASGFEQLRIIPGSEAAGEFRLRWGGPQRPTLVSVVPRRGRRALVVSPFVRGDFLRVLRKRFETLVIVSTQRELDALSDEAHAELQDTDRYVVTSVDEAEGFAIEGLHAKLLLCEMHDGDAMTFLGSANATGRAWGDPGDPARETNCEAMVTMRPGLSLDSFVRAFLRDGKDLKPWITNYVREGIENDPDEDARELLSDWAQRLARVEIAISYESTHRRLTLSGDNIRDHLAKTAPPGGTAQLAPLLLAERADGFRPLMEVDGSGAVYDDVPLDAVSELVILRVRDSVGRQHQCVLVGRSEIDFGQRDDALRARLLEGIDPRAILRAILWGAKARTTNPAGGSRRGHDHSGDTSKRAWLEEVTLENVLEACADSEAVANEIDELLRAYRDTELGDERFVQFWEALRRARLRLEREPL